ncbi:hypothetical protein [Verrucomicrobium spinosum]|uniref:hypothetical protein n=1 Tax=Verrucomicrobium spinosum TaxID=2736 RepID=UPI0012E2796D|nr:hypothetical protein [Verrucomicrobium spinosum]
MKPHNRTDLDSLVKEAAQQGTLPVGQRPACLMRSVPCWRRWWAIVWTGTSVRWISPVCGMWTSGMVRGLTIRTP